MSRPGAFPLDLAGTATNAGRVLVPASEAALPTETTASVMGGAGRLLRFGPLWLAVLPMAGHALSAWLESARRPRFVASPAPAGEGNMTYAEGADGNGGVAVIDGKPQVVTDIGDALSRQRSDDAGITDPGALVLPSVTAATGGRKSSPSKAKGNVVVTDEAQDGKQEILIRLSSLETLLALQPQNERIATATRVSMFTLIANATDNPQEAGKILLTLLRDNGGWLTAWTLHSVLSTALDQYRPLPEGKMPVDLLRQPK